MYIRRKEKVIENRYLFRAKRIDNGEWVEGNLIQNPFFKGARSWISSEQEDKTRLRSISRTQALWNSIEVDSSTICQCTGLKDKNGKLIWENDIVETQYGKAVVVWDKSEWRIKWIDDLIWRKDLHYWVNDNSWRIEVIGNKFDNPELLEVQE
nr:MAG TPA: YopX protein [Caudoviricetes sp.]